MKMTFKKTMAELFSTAEGTYYKWKKEQRPIIALLEKYFTKEDLEEFLNTGAVLKYETPILAEAQDPILMEAQNNSKMLSELLEYHMKIYRATIFKGLNKRDVQFILDNKKLIFNLVEIKEILERKEKGNPNSTNGGDGDIIKKLNEIKEVLK